MTLHTCWSCLLARASHETKHLLIVHQLGQVAYILIYLPVHCSIGLKICIKNKRDFDINRFNKTVIFVHVFALVVAGPLIAIQYNETFEIRSLKFCCSKIFQNFQVCRSDTFEKSQV